MLIITIIWWKSKKIWFHKDKDTGKNIHTFVTERKTSFTNVNVVRGISVFLHCTCTSNENIIKKLKIYTIPHNTISPTLEQKLVIFSIWNKTPQKRSFLQILNQKRNYFSLHASLTFFFGISRKVISQKWQKKLVKDISLNFSRTYLNLFFQQF